MGVALDTATNKYTGNYDASADILNNLPQGMNPYCSIVKYCYNSEYGYHRPYADIDKNNVIYVNSDISMKTAIVGVMIYVR